MQREHKVETWYFGLYRFLHLIFVQNQYLLIARHQQVLRRVVNSNHANLLRNLNAERFVASLAHLVSSNHVVIRSHDQLIVHLIP